MNQCFVVHNSCQHGLQVGPIPTNPLPRPQISSNPARSHPPVLAETSRLLFRRTNTRCLASWRLPNGVGPRQRPRSFSRTGGHNAHIWQASPFHDFRHQIHLLTSEFCFVDLLHAVHLHNAWRNTPSDRGPHVMARGKLH